MALQRLPLVNGDDGIWGDNLNQYLGKEHYNGSADFTITSPNGGHETITVQPGTTAAGTAPLKFTSGPLMTAAETGAVEFLTDKLYVTQTTGSTRMVIAAYDAGASAGATGDIYFRDGSGNFVRLIIGSTNQVLTVTGGLPSWGPASIDRLVSSIATPTTAGATAATDYVYFVSSTTTLTLPTAVGNINLYTVKNTGVNTVTIATTSAQTIDGSTTATLTPNTSLDLVSDTANWRII